MKRFVILAASVALVSGCVSHRSCHVIETSDHTDVTLSLNVYGIVPGICGFTTHGGYGYTFRLSGQKTVYRGDEVWEISTTHEPVLYDGSIGILRDRKRVVVELNQKGYPFELNGKYHYR